VRRIYPLLRPQADYARSLNLLAAAKEMNPRIILKTALMLGLGEEEGEVVSALRDLRRAGCDILCLGQYLAPSAQHYPVKEFIEPLQFARWGKIAGEMGFGAALCAPLARSSWRAQEVYDEFIHA
jgi:lipoic acid synthetase